ncbi:VapE domain-containing protein [Rhizobium puerariae]|uniref:VapE domain-containing protein n=1 Tax=Rhizobium puerariae TaxID=1585791 RepID=A0ABV6AVV5_9HYPH
MSDGDDKIVDLETEKRKRGRPKKKEAPRFNWSADLMVDGESGKLINCLANIVRAFRIAPDLKGALALNEMSGQIEVLRPLPTVESASARQSGRTIDDIDAVQLTEWLQVEAKWPALTVRAVKEGIVAASAENRFHPVRSYLDGIVWDGKPRVGGWLADYLCAPRAVYENTIGMMWLVSAVARVMRPGCQADYMIVLEGAQGLGKSSALRVLGGEFFTDSLPHDLSSKDTSIGLRGAWIVEIAEMASMSNADSNVLKAWITKRTERFRPPFGTFDVKEPRQSVLAGTINPNGIGYLKDETGNRRFWPVQVGRADIERLKRDRDQLWAEAVRLYRSGVHWWPDSQFEKRVFTPKQEERREQDAWSDPIQEWLRGEVSATSFDVAKGALNLPSSHITQGTQRRIVKILRSLGWVPGKRSGKSGSFTFERGNENG